MTDEFDSLFIEKAEINKQLLKQLVESKISLTPEGDILFSKTFPPRAGIVLHLLGRKILQTRNIITHEAEGPTGIASVTGTPLGTVKTYVIQLEKEHILARTKDGQYYVPNNQLVRLREWLAKNEGRTD